MGEVSALFVRKMLDQAPEAMNRADLLQIAGVPEDQLTNPDFLVPVRKYFSLIERIADDDGPRIKFHIRAASTMTCEDYGAVGLAWKTAPHLMTAFERLERYSRLFVGDVSQYQMEEMGEFTRWSMLRALPRERGMLLSNEATLVTFMSLCRQAMGPEFAPVSVHYRHDAVGCPDAFEQYFQSPVEFGAEFDGYVFRTEDLMKPTRLADVGVWSFLDNEIERQLSDREGADSLEARVRAEISLALSDGLPPVSVISEKLGLSPRTLQRRLSDVGVSYQALVDQSRHMLAQKLLRETRYSLAEVAFLTGFSEQSAFNRAFRRWEGRPPGSFRTGG